MIKNFLKDGAILRTLPIGGLGVAVVLIAPWPAMALRPEEVARIAKPIIVLIETADSNGSGVIVNRSGDKYTVLTAAHVTADRRKSYTITTNDGEKHQLNAKNIQSFPQRVDLALTQFTSNKDYPIAKIGNSDLTAEGSLAFVAGFPHATRTITSSVYSFRAGRIIANSAKPLDSGYAIIYSANTLPGMSGGGVFNEDGELIAIHGRGDVDTTIATDEVNPNIRFKTGNDLGIPINTFVTMAKSLTSSEITVVATKPLPSRPLRPQPTAGDFYMAALDKYQKQDYQGAVDNYTEAINVKPKFSQAYLNRGIVKAELGDTDGSLADQNAALQIDPNQPAVYINRGILLYQAGNREGAIREYTKALEFEKSDSVVYFNRAIAYAGLNKLTEAVADYGKAIEYNSKYTGAYYNRANAQAKLGNNADAIDDYSAVIKSQPSNVQAWNNRGNVKFKVGNNPGALADFSQAIALKPDYAVAYANRASVQLNLRRKSAALQDLQTAAALYQKQGNSQKYQEIMALYRRLGGR